MKHIFGRKSLSTKKASSNSAPEDQVERPDRRQVPKQQSKHAHPPRRGYTSTKIIGDPVVGYIRQEIPPHILTELRLACALLLRETGPSDEEYALHENQPDPLEQYHKDLREIRDIREAASVSQTSLTLFTPSKSRNRDSKVLRESSSKANKQAISVVPESQSHGQRRDSGRQRSTKSEMRRNDSAKHKPVSELEPVKLAATSSDLSPTDNVQSFQPIAPVNTSRSNQPVMRKPVAGRTVTAPLPSNGATHPAQPQFQPQATHNHHMLRSESSSHSTSQNTMNTDVPRVSTGMTSVSHTASEGRSSYSVQRENSSRTWSLQSNSWAADTSRDLHSENPDYAVIPTLHPELQRPESRQSHRSYYYESSRPVSRGSSIISNIKVGIRDYIKPRPSLNASLMGSRAESRAESRSHSRASSRPRSRSGSIASGKNWIRSASNGLRRRSSWRSFSSGKGADDDDKRGRSDGQPDLNRSLPPLPGLDQYKEPKIHIASLMAPALATKSAGPDQYSLSQPQGPSFQPSHPNYAPMHQMPPLQPNTHYSMPLQHQQQHHMTYPPLSQGTHGYEQQRNVSHFQQQPFQVPGTDNHYRVPAPPPQPSGPQPYLSPALGNSDVPRRHHSPGASQSHSSAATEEAIRRIAKRPVQGDRSDSYRTHGGGVGNGNIIDSEARSLSALGYRERDLREFRQEVSGPGHQDHAGSVRSRLEKPLREVRRRSTFGSSAPPVEREYIGVRPEYRHGVRNNVGTEIGGGGASELSGGERKRGLRNRLSRLWGSGGNGDGGRARVLVAN